MVDPRIATVEHLSGTVVLHVCARQLGKVEVNALCDLVDEARVTAAAAPFIVDLSGVAFAGSLAMGVLVGLNQEFRNRGQRLIFVALQPNVRESFELTRLHRVIDIAPDIQTALKGIESNPQ